MTPKVRYEIILPLNFNDGSPIPTHVFDTTVSEIVNLFGGCSLYACSEGLWINGGVTFKDTNRLLVVDVDPEPDHTATFDVIRQIILERFQQQAVYITRHLIEVL